MPKTWSESRSSSNKEGNRELAISIDRRGGSSVHGFLLRGLILSGAIYLAFRLLMPLLMNFSQGSAATTHRILVLLFVILALSPVLSSLKPFRDEIDSTSPSFKSTELSSQNPDSLRHDPGVALPLSGSDQLSEGLKPDRYSGLK